MVYAGDQDVFSRSRQISPVLKCTFGWQIGVWNLIVGAARGYVVGIEIVRLQRPPIVRVSCKSLLDIGRGISLHLRTQCLVHPS